MNPRLIGAVLVCALILVGAPAWAAVFHQSPLDPGETWEGYELVGPSEVSGKEYSNDVDEDAAGNSDPGQTIGWKIDGTVWDTFDYSVPKDVIPGPGGPVEGAFKYEVDGLANSRDLYFNDLVEDRVSLLVSFANNPNIYYHRPSTYDSTAGTWALASLINNAAPPDDVDALEVWGPDDKADSNIFSVQGDLTDDGKVAAYYYDEDADASSPYVMTSVLASKIIKDDETLANIDSSLVDIDGIMIWDVSNGDEGPCDGLFSAGDKIIFSIKAVSSGGVSFDGGEIWVYEYGDAAATFLEMGDHTWNTANNVRSIFGVDTEEIDALEALPEPATVALLGIGLLVLIHRVR